MPAEKQEKGIFIGIQNFLEYRQGRNPVRELPMKDFFSRLRELETKHGVRLVMDWLHDFRLKSTKGIERPFRKGEVVKALVACDGRFRNEKIAVARDRTISVPNCTKTREIKLRITRTKHNIFVGELMK